jgi:hypothetical protein
MPILIISLPVFISTSGDVMVIFVMVNYHLVLKTMVSGALTLSRFAICVFKIGTVLMKR